MQPYTQVTKSIYRWEYIPHGRTRISHTWHFLQNDFWWCFNLSTSTEKSIRTKGPKVVAASSFKMLRHIYQTIYDFTFYTNVLFKCHENLNYNIICTANFLATRFQSMFLSEIPDTWSYKSHVPFPLLFHAKNHSKCDILCDISSVWCRIVRPIQYAWWRAMTCHFQHNTLDGMLPDLAATLQWQQALTADQFPT